MFVFVEETVEAVTSVDVQVRDRDWVGDRLGEWVLWSGVRDTSMGSVRVVVPFVLTQNMQQMLMVPDAGAVE